MLRPGDVLTTQTGRYTLYYQKDKGGQGEVWFARTTRREERAIKVAAHDSNARIELEIRALSQIAAIPELADHVVQIFDNGVVQDDGTPRRFVVLERYEHNLGELIGSKELKERATLARASCESLMAVHKLLPTLVHRDIKPANILVRYPFAVISDYGAVKDLTGRTTSQGLQTLAYAPPEQRADPSHGVHPRWDVYAMAATVFHVLVRDAPHLEGDGTLLTRDIERIRAEFKDAIEERRGEGQRLASAVESLVGALRGILRAKPHERLGLEVLARACDELVTELERPVALEVIALPPVRNLNDTARSAEGGLKVETPVRPKPVEREPPRPVLDGTVMGSGPAREVPPPPRVVSAVNPVAPARVQTVVTPTPVVPAPIVAATKGESPRQGSPLRTVVKVVLGFGTLGVVGLAAAGLLAWVATRDSPSPTSQPVAETPASKGTAVKAGKASPADKARDCPDQGALPCKTFTVRGVRFAMVQVPATPATGFKMGSPETESGRDADETQHTVILSEPFWMATTEVTQALWTAVMGSNPSYFTSCGERCPVEQVSWNDAIAFMKALNQHADAQGGGFRLPTEAQWEWAARAGEGYLYAGSNTLDEVGWYKGNSNSTTHSVAGLKPNRWGLFDMSGNVWEWVQDGYAKYPSGPVTNPTGNDSASPRVYRGGSWGNDPSGGRVANRAGDDPEGAWSNQGLRLSRSE